jgi:hypothetical protein
MLQCYVQIKEGEKTAMEDLNNIEISEGTYGATIIADKKIINNNRLKWHNENYEEFGERYITLKEIYQQLAAQGIDGVIYVWQETPLSGTIYQCSNYEKGLWQKHGTTRGYA